MRNEVWVQRSSNGRDERR